MLRNTLNNYTDVNTNLNSREDGVYMDFIHNQPQFEISGFERGLTISKSFQKLPALTVTSSGRIFDYNQQMEELLGESIAHPLENLHLFDLVDGGDIRQTMETMLHILRPESSEDTSIELHLQGKNDGRIPMRVVIHKTVLNGNRTGLILTFISDYQS
ncbi:MAG: PAS domain-containing protein [Candidatus Marinimicrobia bacterium]|nr:PAS domain-containing protein [Candidatus Neomarinimicrobiota bacterium]